MSNFPSYIWWHALNQREPFLNLRTFGVLALSLGLFSSLCVLFVVFEASFDPVVSSLTAFSLVSLFLLGVAFLGLRQLEQVLSLNKKALNGMLAIFPCVITNNHCEVLLANTLLKNRFPNIDSLGFNNILDSIKDNKSRQRFLKDIGHGLQDKKAFTSFITLGEGHHQEDILVSTLPLDGQNLYLWRFLSVKELRGFLFHESFKSSGFLESINTQEIFEALPSAVVLLDKYGAIKNFNSFFATIYASKDDLFNCFFKDCLCEQDQHLFDKILADCVSKNKDFKRYELTLKNNKQIIMIPSLLTYPSFIQGKENEQGFICIIIDNSENKEVQSRIIQAQKTQALGQLAGGIAHDFNNLLTAIIGFCDLLLIRHAPNDRSFGDVMQIKQNANRAGNLVRQLLAFSRQQTLQPKVVDISDILEDVSLLLQRLIGSTITLNINHGQSLGYVKVDKSQLEQVIINLVVNARDAMDYDGKIEIHTFKKTLDQPLLTSHDAIQAGEYVCIEVKDNGCGISHESLPHIFDPFYSTKSMGTGSGMGLSTVHGIINQTGGYISVESTEKVGTTFTLYLPLCREKRPITARQPQDFMDRYEKADLTGTESILLVEDEDGVRLFSARALRDKGYHVIEAKNGEEALSYLTTCFENAEEPVDLIITDVVMPIVDGPALIQKAQKMFPDIKVLFISGYAEDRFRERLNNSHDIYFLPKPYQLHELAGIVKDVLKGVHPSQIH